MPASLVEQFQGRRQVKIVGWTHGDRGVHPSDSQGAAFPSPFFSLFLTLLPTPIFSNESGRTGEGGGHHGLS